MKTLQTSVLVFATSFAGVYSAHADVILAPHVVAGFSFSLTERFNPDRFVQDSRSVTTARNARIHGETQFSEDGLVANFTADAFNGGLWSFGSATSVDYDIPAGRDMRVFSRADTDSYSFVKYDYAPWFGREGILELSYLVEGVVSGISDDLNSAAVFLDSGPAVPLDENNLFGNWSIEFISGDNCVLCQIDTFPSATNRTVVFRVPIVWGHWTAIWIGFTSGISHTRTGEGAATVDFLHTMSLLDAIPTDEDGISPAEVKATVISNNRVPEPASFYMLVVGVAGLLAQRRSRGRR